MFRADCPKQPSESFDTWIQRYTDWFKEIIFHPTKEEIIEEVAKNSRKGEHYRYLINEHEAKFCMEKHEESIKAQLIEKIEALLVRKQIISFHADIATIKSEICEIIRNFKSQ